MGLKISLTVSIDINFFHLNKEVKEIETEMETLKTDQLNFSGW